MDPSRLGSLENWTPSPRQRSHLVVALVTVFLAAGAACIGTLADVSQPPLTPLRPGVVVDTLRR